jgi:hypothetical protein
MDPWFSGCHAPAVFDCFEHLRGEKSFGGVPKGKSDSQANYSR